MTDGWTFTGESASLGQARGTVTLVEEASFALSGRAGDISRGSPQGLFFLDTRLLSRLELRIDGEHPEPLTVSVDQPFAATFVSRTRPVEGQADSPLMLFRRRYVGRGMREDITVRNYSREDMQATLELNFDVDFADLFAVKESRNRRVGEHGHEVSDDTLIFRHRNGESRRTVCLGFQPPPNFLDPQGARWRMRIPAHGEWRTCLQLSVMLDDRPVDPRYHCGEPVEAAMPRRRLEAWRREVPQVSTDHLPLRVAVNQALEDLGSLRLFDAEHPDLPVIAAGAPWFMTLFGRDSLLTSYFSLIADPSLALGTLETLARLQGSRVNPDTDEEPGRILHEIRFSSASTSALSGGEVYYGTADATPLFVVLLGEMRRWGLAQETVDRLLPHADRALRWIEEYGDRDGDGFVEYQRASEHGLANQGWKDSWDGVPFADGRLPDPPIALAEVQAYVYAAYVARAHISEQAGDIDAARRCQERAARLKEAFNRAFWLPDRGWYALALDGDKQPVDALASNMGHLLWAGIVDADKAARVAQLLLSKEMFSGWGIRTLATSMASYNPSSYHCGSVWPHDNAIAAAGLVRYGFVDEAHRVVLGILDAAATAGGRLPELFSGLPRDDVATPVAYPTSCSPQAWAAATPLEFLRVLLRLDPLVPHHQVWCAPKLPSDIGRLSVQRLPLETGRVSIEVDGTGARISELPNDLELVESPLPVD